MGQSVFRRGVLVFTDDVARSVSPTRFYPLLQPWHANWQFWTGNGVSGWPAISGTAPKLDEWTSLIATFERTSGSNGIKKLYVNGKLEANATQAYDAHIGSPNEGPFRLGAGATNIPLGAYYWDGLIDESAIFKKTMTAETVEEIHKIGAVRVKK